jgi:predicted CoA-binding protein
MLTRRSFLALAAAFPRWAPPPMARAAEPMVFQRDGLAIGGTDPSPISPKAARCRATPPSRRLDGRALDLRLAANRDAFVADPERYAPAFGGYCAFAASRGYLAPTIPEAWSIYEDRLYLNANLRARELWLAELPDRDRSGGGELARDPRLTGPSGLRHVITFSFRTLQNRPTAPINLRRRGSEHRAPITVPRSVTCARRIPRSGRFFVSPANVLWSAMTETPSDDLLRRILREVKSFACVGVSPNPVRPSHYVARYLKLKGYRVIPVNPGQAGKTLFGETVRADLSEVTGGVDVIDIFRRPEAVPEIVEAALAMRPGPR